LFCYCWQLFWLLQPVPAPGGGNGGGANGRFSTFIGTDTLDNAYELVFESTPSAAGRAAAFTVQDGGNYSLIV
jgi:hypothetical protein